jgi:3-hydroxybutyryl-CoA dehydrogenase
MEVKRVAIVGAGLMGTGISQVVAAGGYAVSVIDISDDIIEKSKRTVSGQLRRSVEKGRIDEAAAQATLGKITFTTELENGVRDADYVIEAVPEILDLKKKVLSQVDEAAKASAIIASNTSELSIASLALATRRAAQVIGTHWFFPPVVMRLIEVVVAPSTSLGTVETTIDLCRRIGKETVVCKDCAGFITSRAISALISECMRIYEDGIASFEDIDKAMRLGFNHPMGPFQLADMSGVDVVYHSVSSLGEAYGQERFRASPLMADLIREGKLGQKTGKGFYDYGSEGQKK